METCEFLVAAGILTCAAGELHIIGSHYCQSCPQHDLSLSAEGSAIASQPLVAEFPICQESKF